ncbi:UNVERIFIED_CONTAM: hypothetical protein HHA_454610 [Hammondia hammondi]|eukprot:XP_008888193.1 hypothetical protein HHA_454610 [Hammondia hammondi]
MRLIEIQFSSPARPPMSTNGEEVSQSRIVFWKTENPSNGASVSLLVLLLLAWPSLLALSAREGHCRRSCLEANGKQTLPAAARRQLGVYVHPNVPGRRRSLPGDASVQSQTKSPASEELARNQATFLPPRESPKLRREKTKKREKKREKKKRKKKKREKRKRVEEASCWECRAQLRRAESGSCRDRRQRSTRQNEKKRWRAATDGCEGQEREDRRSTAKESRKRLETEDIEQSRLARRRKSAEKRVEERGEKSAERKQTNGRKANRRISEKETKEKRIRVHKVFFTLSRDHAARAGVLDLVPSVSARVPQVAEHTSGRATPTMKDAAKRRDMK